MAPEVRHKEFRFPVEIEWNGGRRTTARVDGKPALEIATPPEFRGTDPELWSPEDAFVAAAGSCLAVTIAALAERDRLELHGLSVEARGIVGRRPDGRFGFVRIEQTVYVDAADATAAAELVARADESCLVTVSLDLPVATRIETRPRVPA
jgi:peroxiredoxin-like protein